jgi:hypothetical protein
MKNYTLAEAAAALRVSLRSMTTIVARHPHYYAVGNRKLFTEEDLQKIIAGLREEAAAKAGASRKPPTMPTLSSRQASIKLRKLLGSGSTKPKR